MKHIFKVKSRWPLLLLTLLLSIAGRAGAQPARQFYAFAPDGVRIAVQEYGNPQGQEVVLVHGLLGSHLDWMKQIGDADLRKYRLITYDLRGHGLSGHPLEAVYYNEGQRWGDELHAVIAAAGLKRPVVVGWSLGGVVISNYLQTYGDSGLAGVVFVDALLAFAPELFRPGNAPLNQALIAPDLQAYLVATRAFLRACFYRQPDDATFELLYANAAMASPEMTRAVEQKGISLPDSAVLSKVAVPVLMIQGAQDALVAPAMIEFGRQQMLRAQVSIFEGAGHAPFFEQPARFNRELNDFVRALPRRN